MKEGLGNSPIESVFPVGHKNIRVSGSAVISVRAPDDLFAVGREHREGVEHAFRGQLSKIGAVFIHHVELEIIAAGRVVVTGEHDFFPGGVVVWGPVGLAELSYLPEVRAVNIYCKDFHTGRRDEAFGEEFLVFFDFLLGLGSACAEDEFRTVRREKCAAVIAQRVGNLALIFAIDIHDPEFEVAGAVGGKNDFIAFWAYDGFGVVSGRIG